MQEETSPLMPNNLSMEQSFDLADMIKNAQNLSLEEVEKQKVDLYNKSAGNLQGYNCSKCNNRGDYMILSDNLCVSLRECACMNIRRAMQRVEKSGLKHLMETYTFDKYKATDSWQQSALLKAKSFVKDYKNKWFYFGGQVGCGKTHICTAIVREFIKLEKNARYMLWRDDVVPLKACVNDEEAYNRKISKLKKVDVLYIDDFFKTEQGKVPTTAEINIAFEILNYRYNNQDLVTIISCEKLIDDILDIDEAVGSRIYQRTKNYCLCVNHDRNKNYRLRS